MALRNGFPRLRALLPALLAFLLTLSGFSQTTPPMNLSTLKQVLAIGEEVVPTNDVVTRIKKEGVDFFLDADMKTELILAAAKGHRNETDTLKIIDSLADSCLPCKERMEGPISPELALRFLNEKVRSKDILKEIKRRGLAQEPVTLDDIVALRAAGASEQMIRVMKPDALPIAPDGFTLMEAAKSKTFDANRPNGSFDVRARVDNTVEFRVVFDRIYARTVSGSDPVNQGSEISGVLPRVPADAIVFTLRQKDGRTKGATGEALPPDIYGFVGYKFTVTDDKSKDARYHFEVAWQLNPFTLATLMPEVEELGGSFPERVVADIRLRGFTPVPKPEDYLALRAAGATEEILSAIGGSIRTTNAPAR